VGKVGATGRATGPHLDWRMNWRKARIDPELLVPPMPVGVAAGGQTAAD
jgi:murein DD-endopeptidase MepM/ murein hydrolase activator NlpD